MINNNDIAIDIAHIDKTFRLPHEKQGTLKGAVINFRKRGYEKQEVLTDFNLVVNKGDFLGILGRNGSGKSTLLKTIAGIYTPDAGSIRVNGKLIPFIELGVGFNPELSGRDNVFLNGALLGFSRKEMLSKYDDIVAFSELERFMDQKLKNYSSGMQVRLAFSIAIQANTDILVLDEVLAVGDEAFQRKCYDYFNKLKQEKKTVILVTHDMSAVRRFCTRAVVLNKGKVIYDGETEAAADIYRNLNLESTEASSKKSNKRHGIKTQNITQGCRITGLETVDDNGKNKTLYGPKENIIVRCTIKVIKKVKPLRVLISFNNPGGVSLATLDIEIDDSNIVVGKNIIVEWVVDGIFNDGKYLVSANVSDLDSNMAYSRSINGCEFDIVGWDDIDFVVHLDNNHRVKVEG